MRHNRQQLRATAPEAAEPAPVAQPAAAVNEHDRHRPHRPAASDDELGAVRFVASSCQPRTSGTQHGTPDGTDNDTGNDTAKALPPSAFQPYVRHSQRHKVRHTARHTARHTPYINVKIKINFFCVLEHTAQRTRNVCAQRTRATRVAQSLRCRSAPRPPPATSVLPGV